jgi:hypothetical protein
MGMPNFELSATLISRLTPYARPLVDTVDSVMLRILDEYEAMKAGTMVESAQGSPATAKPATKPAAAELFDPASPPDLTHTKVISATFAGMPLVGGEARWNSLLETAARAACAAAADDEELRRLLLVNHKRGRKEGEGYRYLADVDLSVQGQDANGAWRGVHHVARRTGIRVEVTFTWRDKPGAAHPGVIGRFEVGK